MSGELEELILDVREHVKYLSELGVQGLDVVLRESAPRNLRTATKAPSAVKPASLPPPPPAVIPDIPPVTVAKPVAGSRLASLPSLSKRSVSEKMKVAEARAEERQQVELIEVTPTLAPSVETIDSIRSEIGNCTRCGLCEGRTQIVHSTGNIQADLMFVGEAPGADEDEQGFPFVGRAGQLLTKIIEGIGYTREEVFIGNINRCRPPGNRQPVPIETAACRPFLLREVAVVRPKVIVVLGNTATQNLLDIKTPISKLRGHFQDYFGVKVMPTFHPAYLLRDPHKKREVWEDMKLVRDYLAALKS
jgi:DNA polymerase